VNGKLVIKGDGNLTNFKCIGEISGIVEIDVSECPNVSLAGLEEIKDTLRTLKITGCSLQSLDNVQLLQLTELDVHNNSLTSLKPLQTVTTIQKLDVSSNNLEDSNDLFYLSDLTNLTSLTVYANKMVDQLGFEQKWMYVVPTGIEKVFVAEGTNAIDEKTADIVKSYHEGRSPFEDWLLEKEIAELQRMNEDADLEEAQLKKEVLEEAAKKANLQKQLEDI